MPISASQGLALDDRFAREFPELCVRWRATELPDPQLVVLNRGLAITLGLEPGALTEPRTLAQLAGAAEIEPAPVAMAYAGHQFGNWVAQLGDGRAMLLGELTTPAGVRTDIHLKGSGPTPFARGGDGKAALAPMLREYLISEAMHALCVPTTRSLAVIATGEQVPRESGMLPGAVLVRTAASHIRVGTFQFAAARGGRELVRRLADEVIERHHPAAAGADDRYLALLEAVTAVQAELVAKWMLVGFVHGVMNTDNTTVSGETIDYGPCAFIDTFDPLSVFSSIDHSGRYAYGAQPRVIQWNLSRLAETLLPLIGDGEDQAITDATQVLNQLPQHFSGYWRAGMRDKLGLTEPTDDDEALFGDLLDVMRSHGLDYTGTMRGLSAAARGQTIQPELMAWAERWRSLSPDPTVMDRTNPVYVPRNHLVEEALEDATAGDFSSFERLLAVVTDPFTERPGLERYAEPGPDGDGYVTYCGT